MQPTPTHRLDGDRGIDRLFRRLQKLLQLQQHLRAVPAGGEVALDPLVLFRRQLVRLVGGQGLRAGMVFGVLPMTSLLGQEVKQLIRI